MKIHLAMSLLAFFGLSNFAKADPLAVGAAAPEVSAPDQDGKTVNFKDIYAKGPTLVYFYPKADTPGCTKEACSIRDSWADLKAKGIQVLGVSEDKADAQKKFADKYKLPHTLIADNEGAVAKAFQVDMIPIAGLTKRQSFLVKDGKVVWNQLSASTDKQAADVLAAYEALGKK